MDHLPTLLNIHFPTLMHQAHELVGHAACRIFEFARWRGERREVDQLLEVASPGQLHQRRQVWRGSRGGIFWRRRVLRRILHPNTPRLILVHIGLHIDLRLSPLFLKRKRLASQIAPVQGVLRQRHQRGDGVSMLGKIEGNRIEVLLQVLEQTVTRDRLGEVNLARQLLQTGRVALQHRVFNLQQISIALRWLSFFGAELFEEFFHPLFQVAVDLLVFLTRISAPVEPRP
mmetsp:Transcript_23493/g.66894  ORF Transcript_23493/g.66894 Transcript_23493/m.66894 type:complete len:230 (-) Transcript_23493:5298-5987(-)